MRNKNDYLNKQLTLKDTNGTRVIASYGWLYDQFFVDTIHKGDRVRPLPWWYSKTYTNEWSGTALYYSGTYGSGQVGARSDLVGPLQNMPSVDINSFKQLDRAYSKALDKLNEKVRGTLDISVALAEGSATARMLKSVGKVERYVKSIGPRRWANEWLELQYGWRPLVGDVYDAANELINFARGLCFVKARGSISEYPSGTISSPGAIDVSNLSHYTTHPVTTSYKGSTFSAVELGVTMDLRNNIARNARWSSLNPVSIAWELLPYSFVVDWFIDIGSYLRDLETAFFYDTMFINGFKSSLYYGEINGSCSWQNWSDLYFSKVHWISAKQLKERLTFDRVLLESYPSPNLPRFNTDLSPTRLISAAALLTQFIPVPPSVRKQWYSQMKPFVSYEVQKSRTPKFAFKSVNDWSHELKW